MTRPGLDRADFERLKGLLTGLNGRFVLSLHQSGLNLYFDSLDNCYLLSVVHHSGDNVNDLLIDEV